MSYKIIAQNPKKGIERSLPYPVGDFLTAQKHAETLDEMFPGFIHRVESIEDAPPVKVPRKYVPVHR